MCVCVCADEHQCRFVCLRPREWWLHFNWILRFSGQDHKSTRHPFMPAILSLPIGQSSNGSGKLRGTASGALTPAHHVRVFGSHHHAMRKPFAFSPWWWERSAGGRKKTHSNTHTLLAHMHHTRFQSCLLKNAAALRVRYHFRKRKRRIDAVVVVVVAANGTDTVAKRWRYNILRFVHPDVATLSVYVCACSCVWL